MKITYDKEADILTIIFTGRSISESDELSPGIIFDYDESGETVSIEILDASKRNMNPTKIEFSVDT